MPTNRPTRPVRRPSTLAAGALALGSLLGAPALAAQSPAVDDVLTRIAAPFPDTAENELADLTLDELMATLGVPGVSVAVIHDFRIHWERGFGVADVETGAPVDAGTLFQAASISKPVAAMASLKAVQDGLFGLDDDVNDVLTSWRLEGGEFTAGEPVTPRTLMSHTSGLGDAFGFPGYEPDDEIPTLVQIFDGDPRSNVGRLFMERRPWEAYEYSGGGVILQQQALEDARGRPFADIARDDVLAPLGMTRSTYEQPLPEALDADAARAHDGQGRAMGPKWHVYPEQAAAGLWTTAGDLARFALEVQRSVRGESNRVLDPAHALEMITPVGVGDFAVGFSLQRKGQGWYFQHGGANWGFRCVLMAHTRKGYGYAVMTNADRGGALAAELGRRIEAVYGWDSTTPPVPRGYAPPVEREEVEVDRAILERYQGTYRLEDDDVVLTLGDRGLVMAVPGQGLFPIFPESETAFFLRVANVQLTFTFDDAGAVEGFVLHQAGRDVPAPKIR